MARYTVGESIFGPRRGSQSNLFVTLVIIFDDNIVSHFMWQWIALKQKAQALFVVEALKARKVTLWEAFTAFDFDNNGILSPSEFYGALNWLGVPDLTAEDVVDFIESIDKNRDGMIDYKEYTDMLKGAEETEVVEHDACEDSATVERAPLPKIEPYGAEELREIMVRRKQAELARLREERLRRQAYKDTLDMKVFEEELEASKQRIGGANPVLTTAIVGIADATLDSSVVEASTTLTNFKFYSNQLPLRCSISGKSSFLPIFCGTAADRPVKVLGCPKKHALSSYSYYWQTCTICKKQNTAWACWQCNYFVCALCFDSDKKAKEQEKRDPSKNPTFFRCANGSTMTIQIPAGGGANASTGEYTISLEARFEKLPAKGNLQSLLRFSTADTIQTRRVHKTNVFLDSQGSVVGRADLTAAKDESSAAVIKPGKWVVISVVVRPKAGLLTSFINGRLCYESVGLDASDLQLQHKIVIFGGGKQAHSRGGDIRSFHIHGAALSGAGVMAAFVAVANASPSLGGRITRVQACFRGFRYRRQRQAKLDAELASEASISTFIDTLKEEDTKGDCETFPSTDSS